jgi:hypothetical protein
MRAWLLGCLGGLTVVLPLAVVLLVLPTRAQGGTSLPLEQRLLRDVDAFDAWSKPWIKPGDLTLDAPASCSRAANPITGPGADNSFTRSQAAFDASRCQEFTGALSRFMAQHQDFWSYYAWVEDRRIEEKVRLSPLYPTANDLRDKRYFDRYVAEHR